MPPLPEIPTITSTDIIVSLVAPVVLALIFWPSYNYSVVKMSTDPATKKPRLTKIDFTQALLFVIVVYILKSSTTKPNLVFLDKLPQLKKN